MHDPKFEQEVQRRMHDLEFVPSDSVWAGIQQGIAPRKRRRAVAVIWWLFPGMLLLAGGIVIYRHSASTGGVAAVVPAVRTGKAAGAAGNGNAGSGTGNDVVGRLPGSDVAGSRVANDVVGSRAAGNGGSSAENGNAGSGTGNDGAGSGVANDGAGSGNGIRAAGEADLVRQRYRPEMIRGMGSRRGVDAPPLEWQPVKTAVTGISRPRHPWTAGFAVGGGAASIYSRTGAGLVSSPVSASNILGAAGYAANATNPGGLPTSLSTAFSVNASGSKQSRTYVQPGYSYWAGIYGEKQLSARWSVDIGLNLHYYSVRFETTDPVLFYAPSSASLFAATSFTYTTSSANANPGGELQTYNNRYYFLEVPATVQWKLNHSRSLPLFWRGGAVLSYLMSSNGLYFNNVTGNVEKDNGVLRHTQASVQSGLMVGLPVRGVQIQAGPEVQYALTSMLTTASGGGHMVYGGMRVTLMR